ncbi:MAG: DUF2721 domain-containing protein [Roseiflexaceae bacterium]|nr:DUF2721 domain-containing protein [Roseiflexaceae bacterium]
MDIDMLARTIQIIIAPVVMISACAITLGGLQSRYAAINDRLRLMARERLDLLRTLGIPIVPMMAPVQAAPQRSSDAYTEERLLELDTQIPQLLRRHRLAHAALLTVYSAIMLFIISMFAIGIAVISSMVWATWLALGVFLLAMLAFFVGVTVIAEEVRASHLALRYEVERVMQLGRR